MVAAVPAVEGSRGLKGSVCRPHVRPSDLRRLRQLPLARLHLAAAADG
jgi:hypothetical protein